MSQVFRTVLVIGLGSNAPQVLHNAVAESLEDGVTMISNKTAFASASKVEAVSFVPTSALVSVTKGTKNNDVQVSVPSLRAFANATVDVDSDSTFYVITSKGAEYRYAKNAVAIHAIGESDVADDDNTVDDAVAEVAPTPAAAPKRGKKAPAAPVAEEPADDEQADEPAEAEVKAPVRRRGAAAAPAAEAPVAAPARRGRGAAVAEAEAPAAAPARRGRAAAAVEAEAPVAAPARRRGAAAPAAEAEAPAAAPAAPARRPRRAPVAE